MAIKKTIWIIVVVSIVAIASIVWFVFFGLQKDITVTIIANNPVVLLIDGKDFGEGSTFNAKLEAGQHELSYLQPGFDTKKAETKKMIMVESGKENQFIIAKNPTVSLSSNPQGAKVFVMLEENKEIAQTPASVELPPGKYSFKFMLNGKEIDKNDIELTLDDEKLVEVFFGSAPDSGVNPNDSYFFFSNKDGLKVCIKEEICGLAPVSFPNPWEYYLKYGSYTVNVPANYKKQHVFARPWTGGIDMVISEKEIPWSYGSLVCQGGFYTAQVIGQILLIQPYESLQLDITLPNFDLPLLLTSTNTVVTFIGKNAEKLVIQSHDVYNGSVVTGPSSLEALRGFVKPIQSEDGSTTRYFFKNRGRLYEVNLENLDCIDLGEIPTDSHLRRLGTMSDFYIGIFNSNGRCVGARSQRKSVQFKTGLYMGMMPKIQAETIVFYNGNELLGFDTVNGEIAWSHTIARLIWSASFDAEENKWYVDSGDWETLTPIDADTGELGEDVKRAEHGNSLDFEKGVYLGFIVGANGKTSVFKNPDNFVVAVDEKGIETWRMQVDDVICSTGFNTNYDLGIVCVVQDDQVRPVDLSNGDLSEPLSGNFLSFPNPYSIHTDMAFYLNGKETVIGNTDIIPTGIGYLVRFDDGSSAYILE
jgi:outer membrane protein assembly factor BamB